MTRSQHTLPGQTCQDGHTCQGMQVTHLCRLNLPAAEADDHVKLLHWCTHLAVGPIPLPQCAGIGVSLVASRESALGTCPTNLQAWQSCTGPPVAGSTPRMVVPVKTRRGSQMNLKGLYRLNQNCMLKVHLSDRRAPCEARHVAVHRYRPGDNSSDMKLSTRQSMWQCHKHLMAQPKSQPCSGCQDPAGGYLMQTGRRCPHLHQISCSFSGLCLRSWISAGGASRCELAAGEGGTSLGFFRPTPTALHNVVDTGQLTIDGRKQVPQKGDVCAVSCRHGRKGFRRCHSASGAGAATMSTRICRFLTCEISVLADGVLKIDVACTAAALDGAVHAFTS